MKYKKNKKAQVQMTENVIILFIFFILLVFSIVFYTRLQTAKIGDVSTEKAEMDAIEIAQKVLSMPELQCSVQGAATPDCYDFVSVNATASAMEKNPDLVNIYSNIFKFSTITIQKIFPEKDEEVFVIYDKKNEELQDIMPTYSPIILCEYSQSNFGYGQTRICSFGVLKVAVYS
ncbi:hypothetical protein JXB27_00830 [Candidatus Woesearchaeota archaeon]|nr:hypothetical protein [Candidatus Woesearchaeota archaeon]